MRFTTNKARDVKNQQLIELVYVLLARLTGTLSAWVARDAMLQCPCGIPQLSNVKTALNTQSGIRIQRPAFLHSRNARQDTDWSWKRMFVSWLNVTLMLPFSIAIQISARNVLTAVPTTIRLWFVSHPSMAFEVSAPKKGLITIDKASHVIYVHMARLQPRQPKTVHHRVVY